MIQPDPPRRRKRYEGRRLNSRFSRTHQGGGSQGGGRGTRVEGLTPDSAGPAKEEEEV